MDTPGPAPAPAPEPSTPQDAPSAELVAPPLPARKARVSGPSVSFKLESHPAIQALQDIPFNDVKVMLLSKKSFLLVSALSRSEPVDRQYYDHHVVVPNPANPKQFITLGGVRGIIKKDRIIIVGGAPSESDLLAAWSGEVDAGKGRQTIWSTIDMDSSETDYPSIACVGEEPVVVQIPGGSDSILALEVKRSIMPEDLAHSKGAASGNAAGDSPAARPSSTGEPAAARPSTATEESNLLANIASAIFPQIDSNIPPRLDDLPELHSDISYLFFMSVVKEEPRSAFLINQINRLSGDAALMGRWNSSPKSIQTLVTVFLDRLQKPCKELCTYLKMDEVMQQHFNQGLENYVLAKSYEASFGPIRQREAANDLIIQRRISLLNLASFAPHHLELPKLMEDSLNSIKHRLGMELLKCDSLGVTPKSKLDHIVRCHQIITRYLLASCWTGTRAPKPRIPTNPVLICSCLC
ncbi:uncharacterized protein BJ171DRAFT_310715 [Polychytrium aggregatum]|uniref:uncharacterized protein n=1 Tax=Polychytrium aggregatum TaxID=110093 RepID=UPI0022FE730F|nr:uncharacterized protein BJ171DRAFT_310715 [Polychytrium aggregatum]KAI9207040.1 hypothetical protein BJ171DRAFT_310715 [Polychytrium aggregatum]